MSSLCNRGDLVVSSALCIVLSRESRSWETLGFGAGSLGGKNL